MKSNNLVILVYHGVTDKVNSGIENFSSKHLHFKDFEDQMKLLRNKYLVLSMDDVFKIYNEKLIIPENSVAITFDDGFKNNISIAAPILDKLQLPATFYVSTGLINTNSLFWVDLIEDIIIKCELNEISIQLESLEKFIFNSDQSKIDAIIEIKRYCKKVKKSIKDKIIKQLILITNYHNIKSLINSNYEMMNWEDLRLLHSNDNFIVGGHSHNHDILANFDDNNNLKLDLSLSIDLLKYNLETDVIHYAYPEGQIEHYNDLVISELKDLGIKCCPSAIHGYNDGSEDLFNLKRIMPGFMNMKFPLK